MLSAIVALSKNHVIGKDNRLLWHLPDDLRRFRDLTFGHPMIMGRKTFESLPHILNERHHMVLTRDTKYVVEDKQVTIFSSIGELLANLECDKEYFVIGGGEIYTLLLPLCETLYITKINQDFEGDTRFPELDFAQWYTVESIEVLSNVGNELPHHFMTLKRLH
ncbi:dihydrofolate reductase (plasmid) [Aneurinibacillus sp. Ricciae_BoGa-3]|uniref:dihydrofolate reductase n=1 Tax=Aneurinibacillus sp. Ricciae_BoGa-3 TaxID=3022697 RepID=UPI00234136E0|nr:dihydrofolate reductase [Aneurinibacillus sp. Ricciae_BoGa-3]WCK57117.1 dihydrofolate reductase [Aneurinibacillus sp. Ricciae_BoGa-3]